MSNNLLSETKAKPINPRLKSLYEERNLVTQNKKYRLHLTPLSHILERVKLNESLIKTQHNRLSVKFNLEKRIRFNMGDNIFAMEENKSVWQKYKACLRHHRWKGNKMHLREYFKQIMIDAERLELFLRWKEEQRYALKKMSLVFRSCSKVTMNDFGQILYRMTRNLVNLQEFTLNFDMNQKITDKDLPLIGKLIARHLPNLKYLYLGFFNCKNITGERIHMLLPPISRNLLQLEGLVLNFGGCGAITDEDLILFGSKLRGSLTNLKEFVLYLWGGQSFTDEGLIGLGTAICQNLPNLNKLCLNLRGCGQITIEGLDMLGDEINKNLNLSKLVLIFDECAKIGYQNSRNFEQKMIDTGKNVRKVLFTVDPMEDKFLYF